MKTTLPAFRAPDTEHKAFERKLSDARARSTLASFLAEHRVSLLILSGPATGIKVRLDQERTTLGQGPGVDLAIDDPHLAGASAEIVFVRGGFAIRGTGVIRLTGNRAELGDGDRFRFAGHLFQIIVAPRERDRR